MSEKEMEKAYLDMCSIGIGVMKASPSGEVRHVTASDVFKSWDEKNQEYENDPKKRVQLAKMAVLMGDMNALDALCTLALEAIQAKEKK